MNSLYVKVPCCPLGRAGLDASLAAFGTVNDALGLGIGAALFLASLLIVGERGSNSDHRLV